MADAPQDLLQRHWMHSHEEDTATTTVYRPAEFKFPPSRGRASFALGPGGVMSEGRIGPSDRQQKNAGRWKLESPELLILEPAGGAGRRTLKIVSVTADRLVIEKPETAKP
jgi:hypothetical protein